MNVYPRQALEATRSLTNEEMREPGWLVNGDGSYWRPGTFYSDAEFATAFVPAERLDALIEAARDAANDVRHEVEFRRNGYGLRHPPSCRPNLLDCPMDKMMASFDAPPRKPGRYIAWFNEYGEVEFGSTEDYVDPIVRMCAALRAYDEGQEQ